jgi:hypothetical protein
MYKKNVQNEIEVLTFRKAAGVATIVTNGVKTRVFHDGSTLIKSSMGKAIAYLEARGWSIETGVNYNLI